MGCILVFLGLRLTVNVIIGQNLQKWVKNMADTYFERFKMYLIKEVVDLFECVCNRQVEELGKVLQSQSVSTQLCSPAGLFEQLVCAPGSQPVKKC